MLSRLLALLSSHGIFLKPELAQRLGVSDSLVAQLLDDLVHRKLLVCVVVGDRSAGCTGCASRCLYNPTGRQGPFVPALPHALPPFSTGTAPGPDAQHPVQRAVTGWMLTEKGRRLAAKESACD